VVYLARVLPPIGLLVGIYVLWNGADHPGGKFQGATLIAAMVLLLVGAGLARPPPLVRRWLRVTLVIGPLVFMAIGGANAWLAGAFLGYPPGSAKPWILAIEFALMPSLVATLALLVLGPPLEREE
jgi:multisubunit Na+/H+ antiporter MnhB subunit